MDIESIYPEFALFGSKNECARTDTVFPPYLSSALGGVTLVKLLFFSVWKGKTENFVTSSEQYLFIL